MYEISCKPQIFNTNQYHNHSRAAIINDYVAFVEEYMTAFAPGSEVRILLTNPEDTGLLKEVQNIRRILLRSRAFSKDCTLPLRTPVF